MADLTPGTIIAGEYRIERVIGRGGMGAVFEAEQLSTGARRALKIMHRHFVEDPSLRRRFEQEARVGAQIESDAVVLVLGAGVDRETNLPWIAMELLQGEDLATAMARIGPFTPAEVLEVCEPLCDALAAAHRLGVVHRDVKPENVFLAKPHRSSEKMRVKVLDFGIAKLLADSQTSATATIGSPLWLAPEQITLGGTMSPATDVWATGLLVFALLTGKRYWLAGNVSGVAVAALLREVATPPFEKASARAEKLACGAATPSGFDAWFARCVAERPSSRFADADQAYAALADVLRGASPDFAHAAREAKANAAPEQERGHGATATAEVADAHPTQTGSVFAFTPASVRAPRPFALATTPEAAPAPAPIAAPAEPIGVAAFYARNAAARPSPARTPEPAPAIEPRAEIATARRGRGGTWIAVIALVVVGGAAGAFVVMRNRAHTDVAPASSSVAVTPVSESAIPSSSAAPSSSASSASSAALAALGQAEAKKRPMATFGGAAFLMGSTGGEADERPVHLVAFGAFLLDVNEVTVESYKACVDAGACVPPATGEYCTYEDPARAKNPVNCVDLAHAEAYCGWLGRRLPTEMEWEYAAAGKDGRTFPWGNEAASGRLCWNRCATNAGTCDVGSFAGGNTPQGVADLAGNVWEWTSSPYCPYANPTCTTPTRVVRGGGWCGGDPMVVRTRVRGPRAPTDATSNVGFRCARSL